MPVPVSTGKLVVTTASGAVVAATQFGMTRATSGGTLLQQTANGASFNISKVAVATNSTVVANYGSAADYPTPTIADLTTAGRTYMLIGDQLSWATAIEANSARFEGQCLPGQWQCLHG